MKRFRYPGVRPFEAADRALFFGRDRDIADLYELVRAEPLVVLFGKSGYGKSSLLNAGMLPLFSSTPELRSGQNHDQSERSSDVLGDDWLVLETRFGEYTEGLSDTPLERLRQRLLEKLPTPTTQTLTSQTLPNSLWLDFKQRLTPQNRRFLLVFDQFEEFFSYPPEQQAAFKDQLADLLYEEMPQAIRAAARSLERDERRALAARMEVKALFAIRSDRMSDLDRLKDRLPAILHKRYELRALTREQAREAIVQPALLAGESFNTLPFEYQEDALQKILDELSRSNAGADKSGGIESFQLQILCDDIDSRVASGLVPDRDGNGLPDVSAEDLPDFSEVFARYYERRLALLPENQRAVARRVIEDGLVRYDAARDEGRRLSVDGQALLKDFEAAGLTPALLRELENTFLVRREPNTLGGHNYELSHDTLLAPVISAKKKRLTEEERERLRRERERLARVRRRNLAVGLAALLLLGFAFWQTYAAQQATTDADKAYQTAEEKKREADEATRRAQAAGEEAENARRIAELEKKNALTEQEKAELERRRAAVEKRKAEALLEASKLMAAHKLPENFDALIPLDSLNCSGWQLGSLSPEIGKLQNLKKLVLFGNQLTSLPEEILQLQNLQSLNLRYNKFTSLPREILQLQNLQSLYLGLNQLTSLPGEIGNLQNLQSLNLNSNQLTTLPGEIGNLQNLQSLDLNSNQLTTLPGEIGNLQNLQSLDLSANQLTSLPREIGNLQNLQSLGLGGNQLTTLPGEIGNLRNLQTLNLYNNRLTSLPVEIGNLNNLQSLDLHDNQLTSLPGEIGNLQNLQSLYLNDNQLTTLPREIGNLQNLQSLGLGGNQLTNLPREIGNLQNLQSLGLSFNQLTSLPGEIGNLQNLQSLNLYGNQLTSLPGEIENLKNLQSLDWRNNQLTSLPIEALKQLKNLKKLVLKDEYGSNPLPASEVEALRQAMPWCEVVWEE